MVAVVQATTVPSAFSGNFGGNVTAGNTVYLVISAFSTSNVVISSSAPTFGGSPASGSLKLIEVQSPFNAGTTYAATWQLPNVAGGSSAVGVTVTNGSVNANSGLLIYEVSSLGAGPALDKSSTGSAGNTTNVSSGASGNIIQAPEFVLGCYGVFNGTGGPPGAPWTSQTIGAAGSASGAGYQIPVSSGSSFTFSATGSAAGPWAAGIATIYQPAAAAVMPPAGGGKSMMARRMALADL